MASQTVTGTKAPSGIYMVDLGQGWARQQLATAAIRFEPGGGRGARFILVRFPVMILFAISFAFPFFPVPIPAHGFVNFVLLGGKEIGNFFAGAAVFLLGLRFDASPKLLHPFLAVLEDAVHLLPLFRSEAEFGIEPVQVTFAVVGLGRHGRGLFFLFGNGRSNTTGDQGASNCASGKNEANSQEYAPGLHQLS